MPEQRLLLTVRRLSRTSRQLRARIGLAVLDKSIEQHPRTVVDYWPRTETACVLRTQVRKRDSLRSMTTARIAHHKPRQVMFYTNTVSEF